MEINRSIILRRLRNVNHEKSLGVWFLDSPCGSFDVPPFDRDRTRFTASCRIEQQACDVAGMLFADDPRELSGEMISSDSGGDYW
jgi:hypothetical protein